MSVQEKNAGKRRSQALMGALAGAAVIAVLVAVFAGIQLSDDDSESAAAPVPAASAPAPADSAPAAADSAPAVPPAGDPSPGAAGEIDPALQEKPQITAGGKDRLSKLVVTPIIEGKGPKVAAGQTIQANYIGVTYADGKQFDSSWDRGQPAVFPVGAGQLIKGWDQGLVGVPVGSRVQLDIPAELGYGENPTGGQPGGDLRFIVDILAAQ